ncbi:hypothetical protein [Streptomyces sp. W1SF4]|uniref:hypothetical protein n=1 Tax=Streptomyces sp. W1SF4 TaxID=2305220 RepID=UPI000F6DAEDC|nr:hypothetical protein [Streptomyces sp. W1SF4]AZM91424.1 hypothetical protein D1J60_25545 [Streptomyces sp. W1SF4]
MIRGWHASPTRGAQPSTDHETGEVRIPVSLFDVDVHQGDSELVLSRREARMLLEHLTNPTAAEDAS